MTTSVKTLAQACKAIVNDSISGDYLAECDGQTVKEIYFAEYGSYNGTTPKACTSYIQGLPGVCTVPFYNGNILELLADQGISRKTDEGQYRLIEAYWNECGNQFYKLVK